MDSEKTRLLYKVARAAEALDLSRSQVYNLVESGEIESVKVGKSIRIPFEEIQRIASRGTQAA
jgi:excisionase family DNA binding protein